jgi:hypothetical protein
MTVGISRNLNIALLKSCAIDFFTLHLLGALIEKKKNSNVGKQLLFFF